MSRVLTSLSVVLVLLSLSTGCRSTTGQSIGENVDDKVITGTVKSRLVAERTKSLTSVDVDTNQGVVYLKGTVATPEQRAEAERIARTVNGVRQVVNNLTIEQRVSGVAAPATVSSAPAVAAGPAIGHHTMVGEVTKIDRNKGHLHLRTAEGDLELHFPTTALQNVREGDRIAVELAMRPLR
jgi:hyperosmotically inducible periplasmic protein